MAKNRRIANDGCKALKMKMIVNVDGSDKIPDFTTNGSEHF